MNVITLRNAELMRGKESVNLEFDPPPDLIIEIDVKHSSLNRMSIFAAIGVPEVWRYDGERLEIYLLKESGYIETGASAVLSNASVGKLTDLIETGKNSTRSDFLNEIKNYSKELNSKI